MSRRSLRLFNTLKAFLWAGLSMSCAQQPGQSAPTFEGGLSLIINIDGLICCDGILRLGIYHDKSYWMRNTGTARGRISMVVDEQQQVEVHGLPPGDYAVAVHQDSNGDGKLNRRLGILPKEPYGFSNNVGKYGPASFEKALVRLSEDMEITVNMHPAR